MNHTTQNQDDAGFGKVLMVGPVSPYLDSLTEALHASARVCALADPADIVVEVERQPVDLIVWDATAKEDVDAQAIERTLPSGVRSIVLVKSDKTGQFASLAEEVKVIPVIERVDPIMVGVQAETRMRLTRTHQGLPDVVSGIIRSLSFTKEALFGVLTQVADQWGVVSDGHLHRTRRYVRRLAELLRDHPKYAPQLTDEYIDFLDLSAPLHDIGKAGIRNEILHKPDCLTPEEFEEMKTHVERGCTMLHFLREKLSHGDLLTVAEDVIATHHEKWDGSGYPKGLVGEEIPLAGRLMAMADIYDALTCRRAYKPAFYQAEVEQIILQGRGTHFDPEIVDLFLSHIDEFREAAVETDVAPESESLLKTPEETDVARSLDADAVLRLTMESGTLGTWMYDFVNDSYIFSENCKEILGYTNAELDCVAKTFAIMHSEDLPMAIAAREAHFKGQAESYTATVRMHRRGEYVWIRVDGKIVEWDEQGVPTHMVGTFQDIDQEHRIAQRVEESRMQLELTLQQGEVGVFWETADGQLHVTPMLRELFDLPNEIEVIDPDALFGDLSPEDAALLASDREQTMADRQPRATEVRIHHWDGKEHWFRVTVKSQHDTPDVPLIGTIRDVSVRKEAELKEAKMADRLQLALTTGSIVVWEYDIVTDTYDLSDNVVNLLGYKVDEITGSRFFRTHIHPFDYEEFSRIRCNHFEGKTEQYVASCRMKARDGKWKWIRMTGKITNRDEQGHPTQVVGTMLDIVGENPSASLIDQMQQSESCPDVPTEL
jgi:putative two-component system response regulator